jgi:medium-chain acyl-[acyl-carrier-protein] hydrolase
LIQPPGRENRLNQESLKSIGQLVSALAGDVIEYLDCPYMLYGHSLGAKVAFEIASEFRRRELPEPIHFYAAASSGPGVAWHHPSLQQLGDADFLQEIQLRYGAIPPEVLANKEMCALLTAALRADVTVVESYRYTDEPPLSTPITCFCGADDYMVPESEALDWQSRTSAGFRLHMLPGGHFFPDKASSWILDLIAKDVQRWADQGLMALQSYGRGFRNG